MTTRITAKALKHGSGIIRRAVQAGDEIAVTFHSKPLARIVPDSRWEETQAELDSLREEVEVLRSKLDTEGVAAA